MSEPRTPISGASSYRELGDYWDSHDLGEVWDATREVELEVDLRSRRRYVSLEPALSRRVAEIARTRGVSPETLVNLWVREKVGKDVRGG
jgi:hypothetical protein